jgi:hypothetical protein
MTALHQQLQKEEAVSGKLCKKYPSMADAIRSKMREAEVNWEKLEDLAQARKIRLEDAYQLHKFLTESREHIGWCEQLVIAMKNSGMAKDVLSAEDMIEVHNERKASTQHLNCGWTFNFVLDIRWKLMADSIITALCVSTVSGCSVRSILQVLRSRPWWKI